MILMYHHVAPLEAVPGDAAPIEGWSLRFSPKEFEEQLCQFIERGFKFIPLPDLVKEIKRSGREPARLAAITFDDGWTDNFTYAFPALQRLGLPATFFVTSEHIRQGVEDPKRMSVVQLRKSIQNGMTIGGHSRTHPNLALLPKREAQSEIVGCKQDLETALNTPIRIFAYPFGAHDSTTMKLVQTAGYIAACSAWGGAMNSSRVLYELYRDSFSQGINTPADRRALNPFFRRVTAFKREGRSKFVRIVRPVFKRSR